MDKGRLGEIDLGGDLAHPRLRRKGAVVEHDHPGRIPAERPLRKRVNNPDPHPRSLLLPLESPTPFTAAGLTQALPVQRQAHSRPGHHVYPIYQPNYPARFAAFAAVGEQTNGGEPLRSDSTASGRCG
jgi:hypothetical protein